MQQEYLRLIDANINRASEGLRVLEDICRFLLDDLSKTEALKAIRHSLRSVYPAGELTLARDTAGDVGKQADALDSHSRSGLLEVTAANAKRAQEAIRVIEEFCKIGEASKAAELEKYRYDIYCLEKQITESLNCKSESSYQGKY